MQRHHIAFIGSRKLAEDRFSDMANTFYNVAKVAAAAGFIIRSGGAEGADNIAEWAYHDALAEGTAYPHQVEIFIPWRGFAKGAPLEHLHLMPSNPVAIRKTIDMVKEIHPAPDKLSQGAMKLHCRNMNQILGMDLNEPVKFCVCWTENGLTKGGTASAIRLCESLGIPVFNLGHPDLDHMLDMLDDYACKFLN